MIVPDINKPYVKLFCKKISQHKPLIVPVRALPGKPVNECFAIVPEHIAVTGGEEYIGWAIWEWPKVLIEAEFHCIYRDNDGKLIDISPKEMEFDHILFLPHPEKKYRGKQVNNIRKALSRDKNIDRLITLQTLIFKEMNRGNLAEQHWEDRTIPALRNLNYEMMLVQEKIIAKYGTPRTTH